MEYTFKNNLLTEDEKKVIKRTADEKIVDLLVLLSKKADGVFFGEQKYQSYINKIMSISDEVDLIDGLINDLESKSVIDLMNIAREYEIEVSNSTDKDALVQEIKVALNNKKITLNTDKQNLYKASDRNYDNTYEHTIKDIIEHLNDEQYRELNVGRKSYLKVLIDEFNVIREKLKEVHEWFDAVSIPATLLNDYLVELEKTNEMIKNNQERYALIPDSNDPQSDVSEISSILENIKYYRNKKMTLLKSIETQKENLLSVYKPEIDFVSLKDTIYNKLRFAKANIEDAMIDTRESDIDKYMIAFNEFFYELVSKQFELENYLDDNEVEIEKTANKTFVQDLANVQSMDAPENNIGENVNGSTVFVNEPADFINGNFEVVSSNTMQNEEKVVEEPINEPVSNEMVQEPSINEEIVSETNEQSLPEENISSEQINESPSVEPAIEASSQEETENEVIPSDNVSEETNSQPDVFNSEVLPELSQTPGTVLNVSEVKETSPDVLFTAKAKAKNIASNTLNGEGRVM